LLIRDGRNRPSQELPTNNSELAADSALAEAQTVANHNPGGFMTGLFVALVLVMNPKAIELQKRTGEFFTRVIKLCEELPKSRAAASISEQLLDSAGGTDSNYGAACKARSTDEFIAKIGVAAEEADESKRWLVRLVDANLCTADAAKDLIQEAHELTSIFVASGKTARDNQERRKAEDNRRWTLQRKSSTRRRPAR
jgi:four helix bundle protein